MYSYLITMTLYVYTVHLIMCHHLKQYNIKYDLAQPINIDTDINYCLSISCNAFVIVMEIKNC